MEMAIGKKFKKEKTSLANDGKKQLTLLPNPLPNLKLNSNPSSAFHSFPISNLISPAFELKISSVLS